MNNFAKNKSNSKIKEIKKKKIEERNKKQTGDSKANEQFDKNWIINKYSHLLSKCERTTPSFQDYQPVGYRGKIHSVFFNSLLSKNLFMYHGLGNHCEDNLV